MEVSPAGNLPYAPREATLPSEPKARGGRCGTRAALQGPPRPRSAAGLARPGGSRLPFTRGSLGSRHSLPGPRWVPSRPPGRISSRRKVPTSVARGPHVRASPPPSSASSHPLPHPEHRRLPGCTRLLSWRSPLEGMAGTPRFLGDLGHKGLTDSERSQTKMGALHWRRPHSPALRCRPGQDLPLTSILALGGPQTPEPQLSSVKWRRQRTSLLGLCGGQGTAAKPQPLSSHGAQCLPGWGAGGSGAGPQGQPGVQPRAPRQAAPSAQVGAPPAAGTGRGGAKGSPAPCSPRAHTCPQK